MSDSQHGVRFSVYIERLLSYLGAPRDDVVKILPAQFKEGEAYKGGPPMLFGFYKDSSEADKFLTGLARIKRSGTETA